MASFTNLSFLSSIDVPVAHWNNSVAHCVNLLAHCVNTTAKGVIVVEQTDSSGGAVICHNCHAFFLRKQDVSFNLLIIMWLGNDRGGE